MIKDLLEKLKKLRMQYNLSQKEVAAKLNISPSIVSGYETDERSPSTENLFALSYLYKCSTDYLLGRTPEESEFTLDTSGLNTKQLLALQTISNLLLSLNNFIVLTICCISGKFSFSPPNTSSSSPNRIPIQSSSCFFIISFFIHIIWNPITLGIIILERILYPNGLGDI